jgi:voltage-gated potassium channel Kch
MLIADPSSIRPGRRRRRLTPQLMAGLSGLLVLSSHGLAMTATGLADGTGGRGCWGLSAQLGTAVAMLVLTCTIHTLVTVLQAELSHHSGIERWCAPHRHRRLLLIVAMAMITGLAMLLEVVLWAGLYQGLGLFPSLEISLYFSGITFTTVGYGDFTLPACWKPLAVTEAINGVLMAGWSTAQLVTVVQRMMDLRLQQEDGSRASSPAIERAAVGLDPAGPGDRGPQQ